MQEGYGKTLTPGFAPDDTGVGVLVCVGELAVGVLRTGGFAVGVARTGVFLVSFTTAGWGIAFLVAMSRGLTR